MPGHQLILHPMLGQRLTLQALAAAADMHPRLVEQFVAYGLLAPVSAEEAGSRRASGGSRETCFDASAAPRLRKIRRLREDLGINLAGVAVALDLLERIEALQRELANFRR
jgi:DNA-binding transcriptional MerR regulator